MKTIQSAGSSSCLPMQDIFSDIPLSQASQASQARPASQPTSFGRWQPHPSIHYKHILHPVIERNKSVMLLCARHSIVIRRPRVRRASRSEQNALSSVAEVALLSPAFQVGEAERPKDLNLGVDRCACFSCGCGEIGGCPAVLPFACCFRRCCSLSIRRRGGGSGCGRMEHGKIVRDLAMKSAQELSLASYFEDRGG